jgi:alpha-mannosidase
MGGGHVKPEELDAIVISETHWDRAWYRTFEQFRLRLVKLVDKLLDILEEDPDFTHYTFDGQTIVLEDYLRMKPHKRSNLERFIANGRILVGPWYVLPDVFLVSGESLIRNLLMGRRIANEFGQAMDVGYIPDPFGHVSQLPQILSQFGYDSVIFARGTGEEVEKLGSEFIWEAPDGSDVLAHWLPLSYGNIAWLPPDVEDAISVIDGVLEQLQQRSVINTCLLMNGSDHLEPQKHLPDVIKRYNKTHDGNLVLGTLPMFVELMREKRDQLKRFRGEFRRSKHQNLLSGVYSARVYLKQSNEATQRFIERWVEPWNACRWALDGQYPLHEIRQAWKYLLKNHPHDDICGCSIDEVHEDMMQRFRWTYEIGEDLLTSAFEELGNILQTESPSIMVFNPVPREREGIAILELPLSDLRYSRLAEVQLIDPTLEAATPLEAAKNEVHVSFVRSQGFDPTPIETREIEIGGEILTEYEFDFSGFAALFPQLQDSLRHLSTAYRIRVNGENKVVEVWVRKFDAENQMQGQLVLRDGQGKNVPLQLLDSEARTDPEGRLVADMEEFRTYAIMAEGVPGLGLQRYDIVLETNSQNFEMEDGVTCSPNSLENALVRIEIDENGRMQLTDKRNGQVYSGLLRFEDSGDIGDEYDYAPIPNDTSMRFEDLEVNLATGHDGPLAGSIVISGELSLPASAKPDRNGRTEEHVQCEFIIQVELYADSPTIRVTAEVNNLAEDHRLRFLFPTGTEAKTVQADSTFDVIKRPIRPEEHPDWYQPVVPTYPMRSFVSMNSDRRGLAVTTRGLLEFEILEENGGTIALTLVRAVGWLSRMGMSTRREAAGPVLETPGAQCQGWNAYEFAITPHEGNWFNSQIHSVSEEYLVPMAAEFCPAGEMKNEHSQMGFLTVEPACIQLSACKLSENGKNMVVRVWNVSDQEQMCSIETGFKFNGVSAVWADETPNEEIDVEPSERKLTLSMRAKQLVTLTMSID